MPEAQAEQTEATAPCAIPRWSADFDLNGFDLQAVLREASARKKSAGELLKELGYPVAELKLSSGEGPEVKSAGGIPVTASTTASDLAGDAFDDAAIEQMCLAAEGSTVFLNHEYTVPEDVYGKVESAAVVRRTAHNPLAGRAEEMSCLDLVITPVGEDENPRAVQVTNMLRKSQLKLGVSVTVLVLQERERPDGGRVITRVYFLEVSIVGIPCNQTAWVSAVESKSFPAAEAASKSATLMTGQTHATDAGTATQQTATPQAASKAMFADVLHENQNNVWLFMDSFYTVYRRLLREAKGKTGDALNSIVNEGNASVDEFAAELKTLLAEEIAEASTQESSTDCYYQYWSAIGRLDDVVQKSGVPAGANLDLLKRAHARMHELGVQCDAVADDGDAAELRTKLASAEAERDEALELAERVSKEFEEAVGLLEEVSREELPPAGS